MSISQALRMLSQAVELPRSFHLLSSALFKSQGYRWELRRSGELKIGLWRKAFRDKPARSAYPRRLVLIPGFGDSPLSWYGVFSLLRPSLSRHYDEVVLLELPGFSGLLSRDKSFHSMDLLLSSVQDVLDTLRPRTLIGHSLGGWLASHYACACGEGSRPRANRKTYDGPESTILIDPAGVFNAEHSREALARTFEGAVNEGFHRLRPHLFAKEPYWFKWVAKRFSGILQREDVLQLLVSIRDDHFVESKLPQIRSRVWLIWGEKDTLIPSSCARSWLRALGSGSGSRAVLLKGTGHSPQVEAPGVTAAVLGQILAGRAPHGGGRRFWQVLPELP